MKIKKFEDKKNNKTIIQEVNEEPATKKPLSGYQSVKNDTSFKKAPAIHGNEQNTQKEYVYNTVTDESGKTLKFRKNILEQEEENEEGTTKNFVLNTSPDHMSASIMVFKDNDRDCTASEILEFLSENGIVYGIDNEAVHNIAAGECYYEDITIAKGTPPVHGINGYYEYTFNTHPETKPIILPDGSVDYNTLGKFELVYKDQLLATYHPKVDGTDGMNILGEKLKASEACDLPLLKVNNAEYEPENLEYYSLIEGKATLQNNLLKVTPVFTVNGDLEAATGDVNFRGDVLVKGNVFSNVTINTTGNITINGHVEVATLIAGKDILLKNGMQGAGTGKIKCGGNLMAKFLEQTNVHAEGNINTNAILNCDIYAGKSVTVSGTRGVILGGKVNAVESINAYTIGNRVGVTTKILVGLETDFKTAMRKIDDEIDECKDLLTEASRNLERTIMRMKTSADPSLSKDKIKYMREKIFHQGNLNELTNRKNALSDICQRSTDGKVVIKGPVNSGSVVTINGITENVHSPYKNVTFTKLTNELRIKSNSIDDNAPRKKRRR